MAYTQLAIKLFEVSLTFAYYHVPTLALPTVKQFRSSVLQILSALLKECRCFTILLAGQRTMLLGTQAGPHAYTSPLSLSAHPIATSPSR